MADISHYQTDLKLEEMEKRLSAIYSRAEKTVQKKMADYAKSVDEKSAELLQAYKDAETEDEKMKDKIAKWYAQGLWSAQMVHDAVDKGIIDEADYQKIVGGSGWNTSSKPNSESPQ